MKPRPDKPRVGFAGVGWIGRHRMEAVLATGAVSAAAIADPSPAMLDEARALAPEAAALTRFEDLLAMDLDGVVIASPSALHAAQSSAALASGAAVFCQKPLGRSAAETRAVAEAARRADRLLAVDLSYRHTAGMKAVRDLVTEGRLGSIHAVDLTFHNAYGPDKSWFYDLEQSGGGCVMDLGVHLVDLALWCLPGSQVVDVHSSLFAEGRPLLGRPDRVEDHAVATITLAAGPVVRLACSWRLHAGRDAVIEAAFYGAGGGASFRNVAGSFYDFTAEHFTGTDARTLVSPPDEWGGRAAADWARRLAAGGRFDPDAEALVQTAEVLDRIYRR